MNHRCRPFFRVWMALATGIAVAVAGIAWAQDDDTFQPKAKEKAKPAAVKGKASARSGPKSKAAEEKAVPKVDIAPPEDPAVTALLETKPTTPPDCFGRPEPWSIFVGPIWPRCFCRRSWRPRQTTSNWPPWSRSSVRLRSRNCRSSRSCCQKPSSWPPPCLGPSPGDSRIPHALQTSSSNCAIRRRKFAARLCSG